MTNGKYLCTVDLLSPDRPRTARQFLVRSQGDCPAVLPERSKNIAFMGVARLRKFLRDAGPRVICHIVITCFETGARTLFSE